MRRFLLPAAALLGLAVAAPTFAAGEKSITLQVGDTFSAAGTSITCEATVGKTLLEGKKLLACYKLKNGRPITGSYSPALAADGRLAVARVRADGKAAVVFDRKPAAVGAWAKRIAGQVGDEFHFAGTDLGCAIANTATLGTYVSCFRVGGRGGRPHSYGFAETERFVAVVQFDVTGTKSTPIFKRDHAA